MQRQQCTVSTQLMKGEWHVAVEENGETEILGPYATRDQAEGIASREKQRLKMPALGKSVLPTR